MEHHPPAELLNGAGCLQVEKFEEFIFEEDVYDGKWCQNGLQSFSGKMMEN